MALADEDIAFIKAHLGEWLAEQSLAKPPAVYEIELRERMVRVEEELKHQRELMREGFERMDQRFEQVDKRFEQVDKRFEQVDKRLEQIDKRFEQVDARFEAMTRRIDRFMIWSFGITLSTGGLVVGLIKFWNP
jgi:septation ring formation regulator EzrA